MPPLPAETICSKVSEASSRKPDYGFKRWYPEKGGTLAQYKEALEGGHKLFKEVTRKGGSNYTLTVMPALANSSRQRDCACNRGPK